VAAGMRHDRCTVLDTGSSEAGRLFEQYSKRILAFCQHVTRDAGDAEDAVQTTFLYAHRALQRGVSPENECAWLHAIARNVCRSQQRTRARRGLVTGVDLDLIPAPEGDDRDRGELLADVGQALAAMPERQRRALLMREWQGLSSGEIASQLGLSAPATYALLTRARRSLAHAMTVTGRRPMLTLDFGAMFLKLKGLLAGSAAKAVATTVAVAGVALGGVTVERTVFDRDAPARPRTSTSDQIGRVESRSPILTRFSSVETQDPAPEAVQQPGRTRQSDALARPPTSAAPTAPIAIPPEDTETPSPTGDTSEGDAADVVSDASELVDSLAQDLFVQIPDVGLDLPPLPSEPPLPDVEAAPEDEPLGDVLPDPPPLPTPPLP
jgi:RNA polymerase sigma factor (sigma-70 family)